MNKSQKNHNPLNLRYARQKESMGADLDNFAVFPDDPAGWRAAHRQIKLDQTRGLSLKQFVHKFAPPNENDTDNYLSFIMKELDLEDADIPLIGLSVFALAGVMAAMEGFYNA